jgi:MoaA/NifB/PqqE/SkfB family radical SAM enzyme
MNPVLTKLPILILSPHSRCNCRCVMCDIWKVTDATEISAEALERHMQSIESMGVEWVVFSGGEPLMHSDLFRLCSLLRRRGIRITILSTGLLLERHADAIIANADEVILSLDGPCAIHDQIRRVPGAFDKLARGVHALRALTPGFPVSARSTVQRLNAAHLGATVAAAHELMLDRISFLAVDVTSNAFNRTPLSPPKAALALEDLPIVESEIEAVIASGECGAFVAESPEKLRKIVRHFRAQLGCAEPVAPLCNAPWVSAFVETDGTVRPCFFHAPIGRINNQTTLRDVLNSPEAVNFRTALDVTSNSTCRRCVCSLNYPTGAR